MGIDATPEYRYWAFISYSSKDRQWARWIHRSIETYGIPAQFVNHPTPAGHPAPKRFHPLFRDRDELSAASDLGPQIEESLRASRYLIVICSPNAAGSQWVNKEVATFQNLGRHDRVLALLVDGEPHGAGGRECFPEALRAREPLAADVRKEADGKTNACLKLLAAMLGVSFDSLRQRDEHRRRRRLRIYLAVAFALSAAFAGLAWWANGQRLKALASRNQAESVLEFLVYDIRSDLQSAGRQDIAEKIRRRVDEYYSRLGTDVSDRRALHNQVVAVLNEGRLLVEKGDVDGARLALAKGLESAEKLAAEDPTNPRWQEDVSSSLDELGKVLLLAGDFGGARRRFDQSLKIRQEGADSAQDAAAAKRDLAGSYINLGDALLELGDSAGALKAYTASDEILKVLVASDTTNLLSQREWGVSLAKLGDGLAATGDPRSALACYQQSFLIASDLSRSSHRENSAWKRDLIFAYWKLGEASLSAGEFVDARLDFGLAMPLVEELVRQDPANPTWQHDLAIGRQHMGDLWMAQRDPEKALQEYGPSMTTLGRLASSDPANARWHFDTITSWIKSAGAFEKTDPANATKLYDLASRALADMQQQGTLAPRNGKILEQVRQKTTASGRKEFP